jgi:mono/diheme cytochrome c family protein
MNAHTMTAAALLLTAAMGVVACNKDKSGQATTTAAANVDMKAAKEMFDTRCSPCHGPNGRGDGPAAAALTPKPRNYTDRTWQSSVTDDQIKKTIVLGGAAVGKSPIMPGSPDLDGKPEVVDGLVKIVRGFGQ